MWWHDPWLHTGAGSPLPPSSLLLALACWGEGPHATGSGCVRWRLWWLWWWWLVHDRDGEVEGERVRGGMPHMPHVCRRW